MGTAWAQMQRRQSPWELKSMQTAADRPLEHSGHAQPPLTALQTVGIQATRATLALLPAAPARPMRAEQSLSQVAQLADGTQRQHRRLQMAGAAAATARRRRGRRSAVKRAGRTGCEQSQQRAGHGRNRPPGRTTASSPRQRSKKRLRQAPLVHMLSRTQVAPPQSAGSALRRQMSTAWPSLPAGFPGR